MTTRTRQAHNSLSAAKKLGAVVASVVLGLLALPSTAFAGQAIMDHPTRVVFQTDAWKDGEVHDVTISIPSFASLGNRLSVKDQGAVVIGHSGFPYGCFTPPTSPDGSWPALCFSDVRITSFEAWLDRNGGYQSSDFFAADSSAAGVNAFVYAGGGDDVVDVADGFAGDHVSCGPGFDWASHEPGEVAVDCEMVWESLGGSVQGSPAVASWAPGRLDVFWRGAANDLRHRWFDGGWWGEESLGGQLTSDPAAVSRGFGRIDVFWRGTAGDLRHKWYGGQQWSGEVSRGGQLPSGSDPTVSSWGHGRLDVFWRGGANELRHRWYDAPTLCAFPCRPSRGGWSAEEGEDLGGQLAADGTIEAFNSDPKAVSWGPNRIDVFAGGSSTDQLVHWWYDSGLSAWESLGGLTPMSWVSAIGVASRGPGQLDVVVRGTTGNPNTTPNALWRRSFAGMWSPWGLLPGHNRGHNLVGGAPAPISWCCDQLDVLMRSSSPQSDLLQLTLP